MPESKSLVAKLADIMAEIEPMKKGGENSFQHFKFIEVNAMMDLIRPKMAKAGIITYPVVRSAELEDREKGKSCHAIIEWVVTDGKETLDPRPSTIGEANDTSDKAANKAQTASLKQLYMKLFQISAEDDNDSNDIPATQRYQPRRATTEGKPGARNLASAETCPEHNQPWAMTSRGTAAHPIRDASGKATSWCDKADWLADNNQSELAWEPAGGVSE